MEPKSSKELLFPLRIETIPGSPNNQISLVCINCRESLDVHQPDSELPDRLLATCPSCRRWHLVEHQPEQDVVFVVLLPDVAAFPSASSPRSRPPAPRPGRRDSQRGDTT